MNLPPSLPAPVRAGESVGSVTYTCKGQTIGEIPITATETAEALGFWGIWWRLLKWAVGLT